MSRVEPTKADFPVPLQEKYSGRRQASGRRQTPKEIAELLYISVFTVRRHRDNIMRKLNLKRLADLIRYALSRGITNGPP